MLKLSLQDFKEEIKAEMYGYEELTEESIKDWFDHLETYIKEKQGSKDRVIYKADGKITIILDDESELFGIADKYLLAVEDEKLAEYWQGWEL